MSRTHPGRSRLAAAATQATIDWMKFWLQRKSPADSLQRERWQKVRAEWEKAAETPAR